MGKSGLTNTSGGSGGELSFDQLKELDASLDRQLSRYDDKKEQTETGEKKHRPHLTLKKLLFGGLAAVTLVLLPFYLLIRSSVYLYAHYQLNGWFALTSGVGITILLLLLYAVTVSVLLSGKLKIHRYIVRGLVVLVLVYCGYGLLYLSSMNVKTEGVRDYYRNLHPVLRIAVSTATLADSDLIVTDIQRTRDDYERMGLPAQDHSLHFEQSTGYVHAVDLRTIGRAEWKNRVTELGLEVLGFKTLRHVGTADHLHVSLPLND